MDFREYLGLLNTATTQNPLSRGLLGIGDAAASVGSGILAQPIAGLAGILATPGGSEKAANAVRTVQNRLTYQPRTETARNALTALGTIAEPLNRLKEFSGDVGYAVGGPVGGMLGATLPDAAMMAAPLATARKTPSQFPLPMQSQAGAIMFESKTKPTVVIDQMKGPFTLKEPPPPPQGFVRLYRGGTPTGTWWTPEKEVAEQFMFDRSGKGGLHYVDIPEEAASKYAALAKKTGKAIDDEFAHVIPKKELPKIINQIAEYDGKTGILKGLE